MSKFVLDQTFSHSSHNHKFEIRWTHIGDKASPPLVFIHGTPWSSAVWHDLATSLSTRFSIFVYDHPGFAQSPSPDRLDNSQANSLEDLDPSLTLRAEASAALFKHWSFSEPPHVVCHDNGGLVSMRLLLQHDIRMKSLCLIDVVVLGASGLPFFKLVAENENVFKAIPSHLQEGFVRGYVESAAHKPLSKDVLDMLCEQWLGGGSQGSDRFFDEMIQAHHRDVSSVEKGYGGVGSMVPVKIIWAKNDSWIPIETASKLRDRLGAEEVVPIDEAGHLIHYDQPAKLALEVGLWLSSKARLQRN